MWSGDVNRYRRRRQYQPAPPRTRTEHWHGAR
jgi:hypothetical protein